MIRRSGPMCMIGTAVLVAACAGDGGADLGPALEIRVAPVQYPSLDKVVYSVGVYTQVGAGYQLVWSEAPVDSVTYGDGVGDITYIGTCDAGGQADGWPNCAPGPGCDADGEKEGWVVIDIDEIWASDADPVPTSEWANPCRDFAFGATSDPTTADCYLRMLCEENADVLVEFNLTLLRDADQGFFDVVVEFEDIFCSAKFDTCYGDPAVEDWIQLLFRDADHDGEAEGRWDTGVLAVACTGGPGADTNVYMDTVTIKCDGAAPIVLDPSQFAAGNVLAPGGQDKVFGYATYFGREELSCGVDTEGMPVSCKKKFWNMAIGFDTDLDHALSDNCTLWGSATASDGTFDAAWETPDKTRYPIIRFTIPLTPGASDDPQENDLTLACGNWALDEIPGAFVYSEYTSLDCNGVDGAFSEFANGGTADCDFCHRMNTTPAFPIQSGRIECGGQRLD